MKKLFTALVTVFAVGFLSLPGARAQNISGSLHDLSSLGGGTNGGEICIYCHTPHTQTTSTNPPLWNRNAPSNLSAFVMYNSPSINMTIANVPQGVSAGCLSCHDGISSIEAIEDGNVGTIGTFANIANDPANTLIGTNLTTTHPISVTYNPGADPDFKAINTVLGNVPLFADSGGTFNQVECGSCHNPHDQTNSPFLRLANTGSALCLSCHSK